MQITIHNDKTGEVTTLTTDKVRIMWHNTTSTDPDDPEWWAEEWEDKAETSHPG